MALAGEAPGTSPRVSGNAHGEQKIEFGVLKVGLPSVLVLYPKPDTFKTFTVLHIDTN